jgi:uncharacterized membrane protein HdeD (DUF308 family)
MDMNEKGLDETRSFVCFLGVVFIVLGFVIILVLPAVFPFFQQNGVNQNGWWLVLFGAIGIIITCWRGPGKAPRPSGSPEESHRPN